MRQSAREGVARAVNDSGEVLEEADLSDEERELLERAHETLVLLLEREDLEAETVERHDVGARVRVKMTRGTSVRDEDSWVIEGRGASFEEARREFDACLDEYIDRWADLVRDIDPWAVAD